MIGYLKGTIAAIYTPSANRAILSLDVNQVGYDLQVAPRLASSLGQVGDQVQVFTHLQLREDQAVLFGFTSLAERDLFRQLVRVNGVGPQLAVALLDTLGLTELVQAIVSGNVRMLVRTPGVGKKTAERIALELKTQLAEWRSQAGLAVSPGAGPSSSIQEDVEMTLLALGYGSQEILQALAVVGENTTLRKNDNPEDWIREAIAWLSR